MLAKRIIPCLDVKEGKVVKGVQFKNHEIVGDVVELAEYYSKMGADELVFYDITASVEERVLDHAWVVEIAKRINIPFCVAGGIKSIEEAGRLLEKGADKISINSPALNHPALIDSLVKEFGQQCVVIGIDSWFDANTDSYCVYRFTGSESRTERANKWTLEWVKEVIDRGAGEIVLNVMNQDGVRKGYDIEQLSLVREICPIPLIASGGAGEMEHFKSVFEKANVEGALAASVFHKKIIEIPALKRYLKEEGVGIRLC